MLLSEGHGAQMHKPGGSLERMTHKMGPAFAQCFPPLFSLPFHSSVAYLFVFASPLFQKHAFNPQM